MLGTPQQPTQKHPTHHPQPVYQNFSVNIDPKGLKKHHGIFAHLRWRTPQNTAGLINKFSLSYLFPLPPIRVYVCMPPVERGMLIL